MPEWNASIMVTKTNDGIHVGYRGEVESEGIHVKAAECELEKAFYTAIGKFVYRNNRELKLWFDSQDIRTNRK